MSDKQIAKLMELATKRLERARTMTKEEAIQSLYEAGILTKEGKFTPPYAILEEAVSK